MTLPEEEVVPELAPPEGCDALSLTKAVMSGEVFVVDDEPSQLLLIERLLERAGFCVRAFDDPEHALIEVAARPPAVVVTDLKMPGMTGIELGLAVQAVDSDVKFILLTGRGGESAAQGALRLGAADYLMKPPNPDELLSSVRRAVLQRASELHHRHLVGWMGRELDRREDTIRQLMVQTLSTLVNAQDARSPHFRGHSQAVALRAAAIAQKLGLADDEVERIRMAGMLHDLGMIAVPDQIIQKPSALTADEFATVREHCRNGAKILRPLEHLGSTIQYVEEHHERWDGGGYPAGKRGTEISLGGQVLGVAEAWTSLISSRPHRSRVPKREAREMFDARAGEWFSKEVTQALLVNGC